MITFCLIPWAGGEKMSDDDLQGEEMPKTQPFFVERQGNNGANDDLMQGEALQLAGSVFIDSTDWQERQNSTSA